MWAIVPIKPFHLAKARLAPVLEPAERRAFMRAMAMDVLAALAATPGIARILVVSREPEAQALAAQVGARAIDEEAHGLNAAVTQGAAVAASAGADGILIVHGDLPLACAAAFSRVVAAHGPAPAVTLVPDAEGTGTNCLAASPADAIAFHFGPGSAAAHEAAARAAGIEPVRLQCPELALDVDAAADLRMLLDRAGDSRSVAFLRSSGIASRLTQDTESERHPSPVQVNCGIGGSA